MTSRRGLHVFMSEAAKGLDVERAKGVTLMGVICTATVLNCL